MISITNRIFRACNRYMIYIRCRIMETGNRVVGTCCATSSRYCVINTDQSRPQRIVRSVPPAKSHRGTTATRCPNRASQAIGKVFC